MLTIKFLQRSSCPNVLRIEPYQIADLEIRDGEATVFGVMFMLLDHALKLFTEVLVQFLKI